MLLLVHLHIV